MTLEPRKDHQHRSLPYIGNVCPPVWHSGLAINFTGHSKAEDLSDEIPLRHSWTHLVGHAPKCGHPEGER